MTFEHPVFLWCVPVTIVIFTLFFVWDASRQRRLLSKLGHIPTIDKMIRSVSYTRRAIRTFLFLIALAFLLVALSTPTLRGRTSTWKRRGIDIIFAFDLSKSMLATDAYPSRIDAARREATLLMSDLSANRIGTVAFAGSLDFFPLTHDHDVAKGFFSDLRPGDLAPGSDIRAALSLSRCLLSFQIANTDCERYLDRGEGGDPLPGEEKGFSRISAGTPKVSDRAKAVVIFSDGGEGDESVDNEILALRKLGIEVYWVGVGSDAGELIPLVDPSGESLTWLKDADNNFVRTRLGREGLVRWADISGGTSRFVHIGNGPGRDEDNDLLSQLRRLQKGDLDDRVIQNRRHVFPLFLLLAFIALWGQSLIGERKSRIQHRRTHA